MAPDVIDLYGNNAVVKCPECSQPFIVSSWMEQKKGPRPCPHCHCRAGIHFAQAKSAWLSTESVRPQVKHTNRLTFDKQWMEKGTMVQFTEDGVTYRYHHDDLLKQIMTHTSAIKGTVSWDKNGLYHFPRLSTIHKKLLEPYRINN